MDPKIDTNIQGFLSVLDSNVQGRFEFALVRLMQGLAAAGSQLHFEKTVHDNPKGNYNTYKVVAPGGKSIAISCRQMVVTDLPKSFWAADMNSPKTRAMVSTIGQFINDQQLLDFFQAMGRLANEQFGVNTYVWYAMQAVKDNAHCYFYHNKNTGCGASIVVGL